MHHDISRGDIYYIAKSKYYATDPDANGSRPGIIVSSNELNRDSEYVEVVYLTSQPKKESPAHVPVLCISKSTALCETVYTVHKDKLGELVRICNQSEMEAIEEALLYSFGIELEAVEPDTAQGEPERQAEQPPEDDIELTVMTAERDLYKRLYEQLLESLIKR